MAEIILSNLVTDLSQLLENKEVKFPEEDKEEVRSLRNEFQYMNLLFNSYEGKPIKDNIMFPVDQIQKVASEAKGIYDEYDKNVAKHRRRNKVGKLFRGSNQARMFHDFTEKIPKLQAKIRDIYEYHIQQKGVGEDAYQFQNVDYPRQQTVVIDEAEWSLPKEVKGEEALVSQPHIQQRGGGDEAEASLLQEVKEEETSVNQPHIQLRGGGNEAEGSLPKEVKEEETSVNQPHIQLRGGVNEAEGSLPKEVKEEETSVNQPHIQMRGGVDEAEGSLPKEMNEEETSVNQPHIQLRGGGNEAEGSLPKEVEEETSVNQRHIQMRGGVDEAERSVPKEVKEEETSVNQPHIQQGGGVVEAEGSLPKEVEEQETSVDQPHIQLRDGVDEAEGSLPKEVKKQETLVDQPHIQQTSVDEAEGSLPKEVKEQKTLVDQPHIQLRGGVDEAEGSLPKEMKEQETLVDQQHIQQTSVDEAEGSQSHALLQKQSMEEEEETLVNQQQIQETSIHEAEGSQSHALQEIQTPKEVEEDVVAGSKKEETLSNQQVKGSEELDVISISGAGGSGKTTLARTKDTTLSNPVSILLHLLVNKVKLEKRVEEELGSLRDELEYVNYYFLKNSEGKHDQHDSVMVRLRQKIRDVTLEAEDLNDGYVVNVAKERRGNKLNLFIIFKKTVMLHNVGGQIKLLKKIIQQINAYREKYNIQQKGNKEAEEWPRHPLLQKRRKEMEEDDMVGFEEEVKTLVTQLVCGTEELDVISISGMGGLGKTTLARKVYQHGFVKYHFNCCAWVIVSQDCNMKELLQATLNQVAPMTDGISEMKVLQLKQELKKQLSQQRYLVVLDDVWEMEHWDELKGVFPNDRKGSRVLVTTRIIEVAHHASRKSPLSLRFPNEKESWELFTKKVFQEQSCPDSLESLGKNIVAKCGGLPLAIVVLGDLLATMEKTENSWKRMVGGVYRQLAQKTTCLDILGLSYSELPPYLKPCFLYLGLFPVDHKIPVRQLIQLWIAEGFIQDEEWMERKEEVAEDYLQALINRCLIQVAEKRSDGGIKTCRVHHLILDLCRKLSEKEKFFESHSSVSSSQTKPLRLAIHCSLEDYISNADISNTYHVRTLICFKQDNRELSEEQWKKLFKCFKSLRVLDLGDGEVQRLPKAIGNLILLKYLRVKTTDIARIPFAVFDLLQLQTLDLRRSRARFVPEGIWRMRQLRHLYLDGPNRLCKTAVTNCLFDLQTLCYISPDPTGRVKIAEKAPNLRKLGLYSYKCYSSDDQESTFDLPYLESLKFSRECAFYEPIRLPPSITKISIKTAHLKFRTIETFQNLPNLQILKLDGASFHGGELVFGEGWFPQLQLLKIEDSSIVSWEIGQGAVPKLKRVIISKCPHLDMIPTKLWNITSLQKLELLWLPGRITKMVRDFEKSDQLEVVIHPDVDSELV